MASPVSLWNMHIVQPDYHQSYKWAIDLPIARRLCSPYLRLECGPMPNVMVALPNIGGGLCSTPQSLADAHALLNAVR